LNYTKIKTANEAQAKRQLKKAEKTRMSSEIKILNSKQIKTHLAAAAAFHNF